MEPQQSGFAYPLVGPYRGAGHPDDIVWLEPREGRVATWRLEDDAFALTEASRRPQGELGLVPGENIPAIGDFNGDGRADIMWHGVSNLPAGFLDIEDVLWLSTSTPTELSFATISKSVGYSYRPLVGDFDGDGIDDIFWHRSWGLTCHDVAWFDAVGDMLHVWRCLPGARDFDCGVAMPTPPDHAPVGRHWGF